MTTTGDESGATAVAPAAPVLTVAQARSERATRPYRNRNGVRWEGEAEIVDVSAVYHDRYVRVDGRWWIAERVEQTLCITGGRFADLIRGVAASSAGPDSVPFG